MLMVPSKSKWRWGFIARDHNGQVFGSGAGKIDHCSDVFQTLKLRQHYRVFFLQWELEHTKLNWKQMRSTLKRRCRLQHMI
jgi:hypothetical protein